MTTYLVLAGLLLFVIVALNVALRFFNPNPNSPVAAAKRPIRYLGNTALFAVLGLVLFKGSFFYAEPGYNYHVRDITGSESVATTTGWKMHLFGVYEPWKKAMSVVTTSDPSISASIQRPCGSVIMLDKVDGCLSTSVRYRIPDDETQFLRLAREYRTQGNLLNTALIPAIDRVMNANAQLMSAEDFFNGGRSTFDSDFEFQMRNGIHHVERIEREVEVLGTRSRRNPVASADDTVIEDVGEDTKVVFEVEKLRDPNTGEYLVSTHNFGQFGVRVEEAIVTDFDPNPAFKERMRDIQEASAARAQAREQRIQEEEQKLYAIAKGEREAAEAEAAALRAQIQRTTEAETEKQLALIDASRLEEAAAIAERTAAINLERARLDAEAQIVLADAEAYAKEAIIEADNALAAKLEAEVEIQRVWAEAFAQRRVPNTVFVTGDGDSSGVATGSNTELNNMLSLMTMSMADRLNYDRNVRPANNNP